MEKKHQILPERHYERGMNHNYMILSAYDFFEQEEETEDYATRMLLTNRISGLIPVTYRKNGGEKQYYYEINSLQSLDRLYEKQEIGYEALYKLLMGCIRVFERLEEYLLDGTQIILNPEYIFLHMETNEPFLVCYPEYHGDIRYSFTVFMDYLLTKIDHTQGQAVWLAYQVYRYTRNPNYVLSEIKELLYEAEEKKMDVKPDVSYCKIETSTAQQEDDYANDEWMNENKRSLYNSEEETLDYSDMEDNKDERKVIDSKSWHKNILGCVLCVLLVLSAAGIIFGSKLLKLIPLSQKQEISLYGAIGMSVAAAVIFFSNIVKRWKQEAQLQELPMESEEEVEYWEREIEPLEEPDRYNRSIKSEFTNTNLKGNVLTGHTDMLEFSGETVLLNQELEPERFLEGNVNGKKIRVPLKNFPITLGKLGRFSDFVIHDNTVSRMHARLEQRNGQIYISDLNSTNGTIRNGDMLAMNEEVALEPGDKILLGRVSLTFC